jgi:transposase
MLNVSAKSVQRAKEVVDKATPNIQARIGRISRCGDEMTRMMLYEAAQSMLVRSAKWSWLKAWAMKIARHRGMNKAIVALARRLAVIMHRIWVDGTEFRWTREVAAA